MAIKVRCRSCRKKILMDEAFAGGHCRCPYCGELNEVPRTSRSPAAVARPDRPDAPGAPAAERPGAAREQIPVARPVKVQGIVALVILALLLLMIGGVVAWAALYLRDEGPPPKPPNVFELPGPRMLQEAIEPPVVYVLHAGGSAGGLFDYGVAVVRHSVCSLSADQKFQLLLVREAGVLRPGEGWLAGGPGGDEIVRKFLADRVAGGAPDLAAAVEQAIDLGPKAVVVVAAEPPTREAQRLEALAGKAAAAGVKLHAVSLGDYPDVNEPMKQLCERAGGTCQACSASRLAGMLRDAPPLPE